VAAPRLARLAFLVPALAILFGAHPAGQGTVDEPPPDHRRSLSAGVGFLLASGSAGPGATAAVLYRLKTVQAAKIRVDAVGDFGVYRVAGAGSSTIMGGLRLTVDTRRRFVPFFQVAAAAVARGREGRTSPAVGLGFDAWVKRCLKFTTELQVFSDADITRLFVGFSLPVREE
jgi:hypothetical protein